MFDFDIGKMIVFGIVALAVIPPKDLPRVMRTVGNYVGKMRRMASDFQGQFMDAMKEVELESVKNELEALNKASRLDSSFDPVAAMRTEITNSIEPPKSVDTTQVSIETPTAGLVTTAVDATPLSVPAYEAPSLGSALVETHSEVGNGDEPQILSEDAVPAPSNKL